MQMTHHETPIITVPQGPERTRRQAIFAQPRSPIYQIDESRKRAKPEAVAGFMSRLMRRAAPEAESDPFVMRLARLGQS